MTKHSTLGASSAGRWIPCPGSVKLINALPEAERDMPSLYADEGTAAHSLGEYVIRNNISSASQFIGRSIKAELQSWPVTREMADAVDVWHDFVLGEIEYLEDLCDGETAEMFLEQHVQPFGDREDMFGTADTIIVCGPYISVCDFKYGAGIMVDVEWNDQLMYYALGALAFAYKSSEPEGVVRLTIVQPRGWHQDGAVRTWPLPMGELLSYGDTLRAAADATAAPNAPLQAGEHCRKHFCPMALSCPETLKLALEVARSDFESLPEIGNEITTDDVNLPDQNDPDQIGRAMQLIPVLDYFIKEVTGFAMRMAERGTSVTGYKLVHKKANRAWNDVEDLERRLRNKNIRVGDIFNMKIRSPLQIEKLPDVGKKWVKEHCHKPVGGLTLVPDADKRQGILPESITDFADVPVED